VAEASVLSEAWRDVSWIRNLISELLVYDINPEPMLALERVGARRANGVAGVTQCADVVFTILPASPEVELTVLGWDGILANARPKQIVVDMSTVEPKTTDLPVPACASPRRRSPPRPKAAGPAAHP
jgi:hypothetical protein